MDSTGQLGLKKLFIDHDIIGIIKHFGIVNCEICKEVISGKDMIGVNGSHHFCEKGIEDLQAKQGKGSYCGIALTESSFAEVRSYKYNEAKAVINMLKNELKGDKHKKPASMCLEGTEELMGHECISEYYSECPKKDHKKTKDFKEVFETNRSNVIKGLSTCKDFKRFSDEIHAKFSTAANFDPAFFKNTVNEIFDQVKKTFNKSAKKFESEMMKVKESFGIFEKTAEYFSQKEEYLTKLIEEVPSANVNSELRNTNNVFLAGLTEQSSSLYNRWQASKIFSQKKKSKNDVEYLKSIYEKRIVEKIQHEDLREYFELRFYNSLIRELESSSKSLNQVFRLYFYRGSFVRSF